MPKKEKTYKSLVDGNVDAHGDVKAYALEKGKRVKPCMVNA